VALVVLQEISPRTFLPCERNATRPKTPLDLQVSVGGLSVDYGRAGTACRAPTGDKRWPWVLGNFLSLHDITDVESQKGEGFKTAEAKMAMIERRFNGASNGSCDGD
jgi:hypothetical protein